MNEQDLARIEGRLQRATPGGWYVAEVADGGEYIVMPRTAPAGNASDMEVIENAVGDLTSLVAEVRRLRAIIKEADDLMLDDRTSDAHDRLGAEVDSWSDLENCQGQQSSDGV